MFSKMFLQAVDRTWQQIGSDTLASYEECGESPENEACVESCIDADRIVTFGGPNGKAAQDEFRAVVAKIGYTKALKEVIKAMPYRLV